MGFQQQIQLSLTVLLTGLVVVFAVLVALTFIIKIYGEGVYNITQNKKVPKTEVPSAPLVPVKNEEVPAAVEVGISGEVLAAIAAAVYTTYGDAAPVIRSVKRAVMNHRSAWGDAGRMENTRPF